MTVGVLLSWAVALPLASGDWCSANVRHGSINMHGAGKFIAYKCVSNIIPGKHMTVLEVIRDFLNDYGASSQEVFAQRKPKIVTERVFRGAKVKNYRQKSCPPGPVTITRVK